MATDKHATMDNHATVEESYEVWSVHGLYSSELRGQLVKESVITSDGKGCHKSWLQQLEPESSEILRVGLVMS
jgi:hypothetical protein